MLFLQRQLPIIYRVSRRSGRNYSVKFSENFDGHVQATKPRLADFRYPLFHTFLLASSVYMGLNALWYSLEYEQVENSLIKQANKLEDELQRTLEEVKSQHIKSADKWYSKLKFWS
ncbi:putative small nuclear ribonucleoprotein [Clavispora lusitaniae]|uniref:Small nuclear ribonucleoprotein n=1 Tax=Clavispora lusitaniae TaxID=36911 RepID=A0ACD0WM84_CLALS|nr:putative small nuclear ribonucleoprotein [Clavispora lusitaniae]QFZ34302.1 putative small nuclear ribonucleoprotein [Clavispora lusitaniae]QFZ39986.1 putative small nuclear ribonucleoprotein [Clavispora lusitaniae]QFZ45668.1 putative small nuclear ribonucleoprotein [Clavispora lusitaniae]QFZ51332.1 putative small nuclear ribonucleoprotein [Clavispora lusitaniae]